MLKEVDHKNKVQSTNGTVSNGTADGVDNPGFELKESPITNTMNANAAPTVDVIGALKKNPIVEFFNPVVAVGCVEVVSKKREYNGRTILWVLLLMYLIAIGPAFGI